MVKKVITNLDSSCPDCIPVVCLKNCEPELSCILVELFIFSERVLFSYCWKVSLVVPIFMNVDGRSTATNYCLVSLLSVISKVLERLVD